MELDKKAKNEGKTYTSSTGPDFAAAKKAMKDEMSTRRSKVSTMKKEDKTCPYYPHFCSKKGYTSAASKECEMHLRSKKDKIKYIEN